MIDLHAIQTEIVARITERPVGSASRFALMNAADAVSKAIEAEEREAGAQIDGNQSSIPATTASEGGAELEGNQA